MVILITVVFISSNVGVTGSTDCFGNDIQSSNLSQAASNSTKLPLASLDPLTANNVDKLLEVSSYDFDTKPTYVEFSSDGNSLISGNAKTLHIIDVLSQTEETIKISDNSFIQDAAFDKLLTPLMLKSTSNSLKAGELAFNLTNTKTKQNIAFLPLSYRETINDIKFTPNNQCVAFASSYSKIRLWNITIQTEKTLDARNQVTSIDFSVDGKLLAYGTYGDNDSSGEVAVAILDLENNKELEDLKGHTTTITKVLFSHDGKTIASSSWDKTIRLWNIATGKELFILQGHSDGVTDFTFSNDDKLIASVSRDGAIRLWDTSTGKQVSVMNTQSPLMGVSFNSNMKLLISISENGTAYYWGYNH